MKLRIGFKGSKKCGGPIRTLGYLHHWRNGHSGKVWRAHQNARVPSPLAEWAQRKSVEGPSERSGTFTTGGMGTAGRSSSRAGRSLKRHPTHKSSCTSTGATVHRPD
ncbi:hypothetical protein R1flu_025901 [Riccia fluitans]|uniref:Uncharacterized protein n=1 Tax=Riccia fluitans TaxID=41844 RepID=A0ABD1XZ32_9MARC